MTPVEFAHGLGLKFGELYVTRWFHPPADNRDPDARSFRYFLMFCPDGQIASAPVMAEPAQVRSWFTCGNESLLKGRLGISGRELIVDMTHDDGRQIGWRVDVLDPESLHLVTLGEDDTILHHYELAPR